jgi:hypothetical protein
MQPALRLVIANPQGEAIQCTRMDCFLLCFEPRNSSQSQRRKVLQLWRSCVVIGKNTLHFNSAERGNGDLCSLPAASVIANPQGEAMTEGCYGYHHYKEITAKHEAASDHTQRLPRSNRKAARGINSYLRITFPVYIPLPAFTRRM